LGAIEDNQEVRFSQSDVQVGFPEEVNEPVTATEPTMLVEGLTGSDTQKSDGACAFAFANAVLGIAAEREVANEPINPDPIAETMSSVANEGNKTGAEDRAPPGTSAGRIVSGSKEEAVAMKLKYDNRQRMIREIAVSQLLQEELTKSNLSFGSVISFMNKVCGTDSAAQKLEEAALSAIQKGAAI